MSMPEAESHAPDTKETAVAVAAIVVQKEAVAAITTDAPAAENKPVANSDVFVKFRYPVFLTGYLFFILYPF